MAKMKKTAWGKRETSALIIDSLFERAEEQRGKFLLDYGWTFGCDYPDSVWRWSKIINGRQVSLSEAAAFEMERNFLEPAPKENS